MAVKKTAPKATEEKAESIIIETKTKEEPKTDPVRFCVYIGPNIRGIIQSGTIYKGTREETEDLLFLEIEKHPLIAKLISTDKTIAKDRIRVKTTGNMLNVYYEKLASGNLN